MTKKNYYIYSLAIFAITTLLFATSCKREEFEAPAGDYANSVVGVLKNNQDYTLFISALEKAELIRPLNDAGPFTVFAPSNAALQAAGITNTTIDTSNTRVGKTNLMNLLTYHFIGGNNFNPSSVADSDSAETAFTNANGTRFFITNTSKGVYINGVKVSGIGAIPAANGIVHTIDKALIVPTISIDSVTKANSNFSILAKALAATGVSGDLAKSDETYTLFAPTNAAFTDAGITEAYVDDLVKKQTDAQSAISELTTLQKQLKADTATYKNDPVVLASLEAKLTEVNASIAAQEAKLTAVQDELNVLKNILLYHVVPRVHFAGNVTTRSVGTLLKDKKVTIDVGNAVALTDANGNSANITEADMITINGVVHTIDKVLMP